MDSYIFKVLTAGDGGVGKTTLLNRFITGQFLFDSRMTMGVQILKKELEINDNYIRLQLWDFGGQAQFRFMLKHYVQGAHGAIIMFDLTNFITLKNIENWIDICKLGSSSIPLILIGGKADLVDLVSINDEYLREMKEKYDFIDYLKTSSKTGENIDEVFKILTKKMIELEILSY